VTLSIENLSMRFDLPNGGSVQALKDIAEAAEGRVAERALGPSGCGKTTLLNIVAGFLAPTEGQVTLNGTRSPARGAERGMVFQQGALFEWMSVRDNVSFGPRMKGRPESETAAGVDHLLRRWACRISRTR
jgi:taurine transport system ATP-binding protein